MKAACKSFGKCSGCSLQQFPYVKQLHDKSRLIENEFASLCPNQDLTRIRKIVASPLPFGYRTSSKICLHEDELGRRSLGLYEQGSKRVLDIPDCPVHDPEINRLVQRLFGFGKALPDRLYNHTKKVFQESRLKFLTVRYCPSSREFGIVLSHTGVDRLKLEAWAKTLNLSGISLYEATLSREDEDLVLPHQTRFLGGKQSFAFNLGDRSFPMNPAAFVQANYSLVPQFIDAVTAGLKGEMLLDLYGGFGTYSFAAQQNFAKVVLVEANPYSIAAAHAQKSAVLALALSVEDYLKQYAKQCQDISDVIVNPPRNGLSPGVSKALAHAQQFPKLKTLTYVSCNRISLKRDLKILLQSGRFRIESLTPFDMFPQTEHIELVVRLKVLSLQKPQTARPPLPSRTDRFAKPGDKRWPDAHKKRSQAAPR